MKTRLGRGGGYYDRFLAHYKGAGLLLCPEALLLDELPCDDWDGAVDEETVKKSFSLIVAEWTTGEN